MRRIAVLGAGLAAGLTLAGCGMSSGAQSQAAPAASHLSAVRIERRAERAFARARSVEVVERFSFSHHRSVTENLDITPTGDQVVVDGAAADVTTRLVGSRMFVDANATGDLGDTLSSEGLTTRLGSWLQTEVPHDVAVLAPISRLSNEARCALDPRLVARPRYAGAGQIDGVPTDALRFTRRHLGTTTMSVASGPPYLPLRIVAVPPRRGQLSRPVVAHLEQVASQAGCGPSPKLLARLRAYSARLARGRSVPALREVQLTYQRYDAIREIAAPRHARAFPFPAALGG